MSFRRLLNLAYDHLVDGMDAKGKANMELLLRAPFDYELTPEEQARAERRRIAMRTGAYEGQSGLIGAFGLKS